MKIYHHSSTAGQPLYLTVCLHKYKCIPYSHVVAECQERIVRASLTVAHVKVVISVSVQ